MVESEDLLGELGRLVRQQEESDVRRLEALCTALPALTTEPEVSSADPALGADATPAADAATRELCRPIAAGRQAAMVDAIALQLSQAKQAESRQARAKVISLGPLWLGVPVLAAAAALALWPRSLELEPIAHYQPEIRGALSAQRGREEPPAALILEPAGRLVLILRPETEISGEVGARVYLGNGERQLLAVAIEPAASGSLRLDLQLPADLPANGTLTILVGRESELGEERLHDAASAGLGWQRLHWRFERRGDKVPRP